MLALVKDDPAAGREVCELLQIFISAHRRARNAPIIAEHQAARDRARADDAAWRATVTRIHASMDAVPDTDAVQISVDKESAPMPASLLPAGAPGPSNASSLIGSDPATAWAKIDGHSTPIPTCSDNVAVFLRRVRVSLRWNAWLERIEICKPGENWTAYSDHHFDELMTTAAGALHRFRPSADLFRRALSTLAREHAADPVIDLLAALEKTWDGTHRLKIWLSATCGVPCDTYYQAVGAAIVGGMVRRIRHPGCKFDLMPVFVGAQGAGKSTLAEILALNKAWFTDNVSLGIESKELLPLLRGKSVVEVSEMRTRGEVD